MFASKVIEEIKIQMSSELPPSRSEEARFQINFSFDFPHFTLKQRNEPNGCESAVKRQGDNALLGIGVRVNRWR